MSFLSQPPVSHLKLSHYLTATDPFVHEADGIEKRVVFGARQARVFVLSEAHWRELGAGNPGVLPADLRERLVESQILVPEEEDELRAVLAENRREILDGEALYSVIQPSANCQLGCHYCGQEHAPRGLSEAHSALLVERLRSKLREGRYKELLICWFGGEPLLGLPVMRSLTPRLRDLAREFGCEFSAKVATNGLSLTPAVVTELSGTLGVRHVEVCIDGLREQHDSRRPMKSGRGSFERIFANVVALASRDDLDMELTIRCNVDRSNHQDVIPLMDLFVSAGVQGRLARFYVAPIHSWGNEADKESLSPEEFARMEADWLAGLVRRGFPVPLLPRRREVVCMAVQPESEVIDAAGNVFNCTEVSQVPAYESGASRFGNVYAEGHLGSPEVQPEAGALRAFNDVIERRQVPCHQCRILPVCGGKCPKLWLEGKVPCPPLKHNLPERLMLAHLLATHGVIHALEEG